MEKEGDRQGRRHAGEQGRRREQEEEGGEAAAVDANRRGWDSDAANGEMIQLTAKEKEKERVRATRDFDTVAEMAVAVTKGRRKRRHRQSSSSSEEEDDKEEGERRSPSSVNEEGGNSGGGRGQIDRRN